MSEADDKAFARITELVGEMAWGIDLPADMTVLIKTENGDPPQEYDVDPLSYKVVYDAIWQKLKLNEGYNPYVDLQLKLQERINENQKLQYKNDELEANLEIERRVNRTVNAASITVQDMLIGIAKEYRTYKTINPIDLALAIELLEDQNEV